MSDLGEAILQSIAQLSAHIDGQPSAIQRHMSAMDGRLTTVEARLANVENAVANIDGRITTWPDMHYLAAAARAQMAHTRERKADVVELKVRLAEICQAMATDSEIKTLREDAARFREHSFALDVRVGAIESRLGLGTEPSDLG